MSKMTKRISEGATLSEHWRRVAPRGTGDEAGKAAGPSYSCVCYNRSTHALGSSQARFAQVLGVSTRTLQEWEQGRRQPSGAARALLTIAARQA